MTAVRAASLHFRRSQDGRLMTSSRVFFCGGRFGGRRRWRRETNRALPYGRGSVAAGASSPPWRSGYCFLGEGVPGAVRWWRETNRALPYGRGSVGVVPRQGPGGRGTVFSWRVSRGLSGAVAGEKSSASLRSRFGGRGTTPGPGGRGTVFSGGRLGGGERWRERNRALPYGRGSVGVVVADVVEAGAVCGWQAMRPGSAAATSPQSSVLDPRFSRRRRRFRCGGQWVADGRRASRPSAGRTRSR